MKKESFLAQEPKYISKNPPHIMPLTATSSFVFETTEEGRDIFSQKEDGYVYSRYGNPTVDAVGKKIADMEMYGLEEEGFGLMTSSGMSAISSIFIALLEAGDTVLTQKNLYGGTAEFIAKYLEKLGIKVIWADLFDIDIVQNIFETNKVDLLFCETPANPTLSCLDLDAITEIAQANNCVTVVDNSFCTPYIQQPLLLGANFVIHSTTKFLNGHGNSIGGVIVGRDKLHEEIVLDAIKLSGTNCSPFEAWLINNGMKTLALRMDRHSQNAMTLASFLEMHPQISHVNYPFLKSHESHELAKKQMMKGGGMISFELVGGFDKALQFTNNLNLCTLAPTFGDTDSLIIHPASSSHRNIDPKIRTSQGITDGLIRMSVGIEHIDDIIADIQQAI